MGYAVLLPTNKKEGVSVIHAGQLDVVILSYTLPDETVKELADLLAMIGSQCNRPLESSGLDGVFTHANG
jgi:DNA-binding response OmpR family regulator